VGRNLWSVLRHLKWCIGRYLSGRVYDCTDTYAVPRHFWIDALCINQVDTTQRNHQVYAMGQTYSEARLVIAWLGVRSPPDVEIAMVEIVVSLRHMTQLSPFYVCLFRRASY
jgi:hypothetical protein